MPVAGAGAGYPMAILLLEGAFPVEQGLQCWGGEAQALFAVSLTTDVLEGFAK